VIVSTFLVAVAAAYQVGASPISRSAAADAIGEVPTRMVSVTRAAIAVKRAVRARLERAY